MHTIVEPFYEVSLVLIHFQKEANSFFSLILMLFYSICIPFDRFLNREFLQPMTILSCALFCSYDMVTCFLNMVFIQDFLVRIETYFDMELQVSLAHLENFYYMKNFICTLRNFTTYDCYFEMNSSSISYNLELLIVRTIILIQEGNFCFYQIKDSIHLYFPLLVLIITMKPFKNLL